jgi:microcystin-dependent protein
VGVSATHTLGERSGEQGHTLVVAELPAHGHAAKASSATTDMNPIGHYWAPDVAGNVTFATAPNTALTSAAIANTGGNQAHLNMQPFLTLNFCIALVGIFPSQT